jgi:ABC-type nickel/cobalt efflux system permease component RcnA
MSILALLFCIPQSVAAHPMGNFSINHFSAIEAHPTLIRVSYVIDMAEIPTFQEMQAHGLTTQADDPSGLLYRERKVEELRQGLDLRLQGKPLTLSTRTSTLSFPPGAGGLPTLRIAATYEAPLEALTGEVTYEDRNYAQRVGWKEIVANTYAGVTLRETSVPAESHSQRLTNYAENLLQAPPQTVRAALTFEVPAAARTLTETAPATANPAPERMDVQTPKSMLTELITARQLSAGVIIFSLLVAVGLGAFHALEPGHGKTLVAAYLIGSRGTAWHALILGLTVTVSHTVGVYALGGVALFTSHYIVPEQLYPWLGLTSGLLIVGTGLMLFGQALQRQHDHQGHTHDHNSLSHEPYEHGHTHHTHTHERGHEHSSPHRHGSFRHNHDNSGVGYGALLTLGVTGGLIPCPAALVVLLSAVALQRIVFGLLLIVAFSVGLAAVLVGTGLLLVSARGLVQHWTRERQGLAYLPFLSPLVITPLGIVIAVRSLMGTGMLPGFSF